jgi:hypothetical protein
MSTVMNKTELRIRPRTEIGFIVCDAFHYQGEE